MAAFHDKLINDIHVHLGWSDGINNFLDPDKLDGFISKNNIDEVALIPFEKDTTTYNRKIIQLSKQNSKIHGFYWIRKDQISEDLKILEECIGDGLIGVKFHGTYENLPVSDESYLPVMQLLDEKQAILLVHCGRYKDGYAESNTSFLHGLQVAKTFPKIKVVLAHMGGNDTSITKRAVTAAVENSNVYFDTSGTSTPYRIEHAVSVLGTERILFGSDFPWCSFKAMYYNVNDSLLDENTKHAILHENFVKLLRSA
ncbi:MAG: amidohydrolase family protein [Thaumarchaeota archaeon]|nr:amidohydrolase family protein [Nitrososphaerota archaeon]